MIHKRADFLRWHRQSSPFKEAKYITVGEFSSIVEFYSLEQKTK